MEAVSPVSSILFIILMPVVAVLGAVMVVTGRQPVRGWPQWPREGGPLRILGTVYVLVGAAMTVLTARDGAPWDAVLIGYFFAVFALLQLYGGGLSGRLRRL